MKYEKGKCLELLNFRSFVLKSSIVALFTTVFSLAANCQDTNKFNHSHIGSCTGGAYSINGNKHSLTGKGADIWNSADDFDFASVKLKGNMQIVAKVTSLDSLDEWTKVGVMIRQDLSPGSAHAMMVYTPQEMVAFQWRNLRNSTSGSFEQDNNTLPVWLKIVRLDSVLYGQVSSDSLAWTTIASTVVNLPDSVYYGLCLTSHAGCSPAKATFENVQLSAFSGSIEPPDLVLSEETIFSDEVNDSYRIITSLPKDYNENFAGGYPIVYFLDGNNTENHRVVRELTENGLIPPAIVVGIAYPATNQRNRDYTSVGYQNFYRFIKNELIPLYDSKYNINTKSRTIAGHSYGGLFCLYALCSYSGDIEDPFQNFIPSSPSIWEANRRVLDLEEELSNQTNELDVNIYMATGSLEGQMVTDMQTFNNALLTHNYDSLNLKTVVNQGYDHGNNWSKTWPDGLTWLFKDYEQPIGTGNQLVNQAIDKNAMLYPNPTNGRITLYLGTSQNKEVLIEMYNLQGALVFSKTFQNTPSATIDLTGNSSGLYLVKVIADGEIHYRKICVE